MAQSFVDLLRDITNQNDYGGFTFIEDLLHLDLDELVNFIFLEVIDMA